MSKDTRFYGYKHWTLEESPRCFNVGKGTKRRPYNRGLKRRNHKWHAIVKRYGLRVEVCIGPVSNEEACAWEIEQIAAMGTFSTDHAHDSDDIGCNFTRGGEGTTGHSQIMSDEARQKMSLAKRGKAPWNKGGHLSEEQLLKMRGRFVSQETREKISLATRGRTAPNKGRPVSDAVKQKLRDARAKQVIKHSSETRQRQSEAAKRRYARLHQPTYDHASEDASATSPDSGSTPE